MMWSPHDERCARLQNTVVDRMRANKLIVQGSHIVFSGGSRETYDRGIEMHSKAAAEARKYRAVTQHN